MIPLAVTNKSMSRVSFSIGKTTAPNIALVQAPDGGKDGPGKNVETALCGPCDASTFIIGCFLGICQTNVELSNSGLSILVLYPKENNKGAVESNINSAMNAWSRISIMH